MTLSRFLRDYIYIPLGGNKISSFRTYVNLLATFVIGGLWHGAGWTFIFWGFLHGMALIIHRIWTNLGFKMWTWLAWFITFNFVNIAWIFFRAKEWDDAIKVLKGMIGLSGMIISDKLLYKIRFFKQFISENPELFGKLIFGSTAFTFILYGLLLSLIFKNTIEWSKQIKFNYKTLFFLLIITIGTLFNMSKVSEFLYFNF